MIISLSSCKSDLKNGSNDSPIESFSNEVDSLSSSIKNNPVEQNEKIAENAELSIQLSPIKENFKRINSIKSWSEIDTIQLYESLEGGEARYYRNEGKLEKIITHHFGETSQMIIEYYLLGNELSFVFIQTYIYNLPISFDEAINQESDKNEKFDIEQSEIREERYYFENENLIHVKKSSGDEGFLTKDDLKSQQNRILREFNQRVKNSIKNSN